MKTNLNRIKTFITVADCGSYTRAAEILYISKSVASIHVKSLEESLGVTLLIRNTRSLALTEEGRCFYYDFKIIFENIQYSLDKVTQAHSSISGKLRITSTYEFGNKYLLPLIMSFCELHPQIDVSYEANSSLNNLISEHIDLAVRLGTLKDSAFRSRRITSYAIVLVATPSFIQRYSLISPIELNDLDWIANSNLENPTHWFLHQSHQPSIEIKARAKHTSNSTSAIRTMALSSLGVAVLPEWMIEDDISNGRLVHLFPDYHLPEQSVNILFPNNQNLQFKSRTFIDYLLTNLKL